MVAENNDNVNAFVDEQFGVEQHPEPIPEEQAIYLRLDWEEGFTLANNLTPEEAEAIDALEQREADAEAAASPAKITSQPTVDVPLNGTGVAQASKEPATEQSGARSPVDAPARTPSLEETLQELAKEEAEAALQPAVYTPAIPPEGLNPKELAKFLERDHKAFLKTQELARKEVLKEADRLRKENDRSIKEAAKLFDKQLKEKEMEAQKREKEERAAETARTKKAERMMMMQAAAEAPSAELEYARALSASPDLAVRVMDEYAMMYEWVGTYWTPITFHGGSVSAFRWLEQHFPSMATARMAESSYRSALFRLQPLPPKPTENIIPMNNVWLFVGEDGDLQIKQPDRAWGVTHNIKANLAFPEHSRFYVPKKVPADSLFGKFLASALPDTKEESLVAEWCGSTLISSVRFGKAMVWEGGGSNGKSVLAKILETLHERVAAVDLDNLQGFQIAPVNDASLALSAETPKGQINENVLKKMVTGDLVQFEFKNKQPFSSHPSAKWLMLCNRFPKITDETNGLWRRLIYVKWSTEFAEADQIKDLEQQIIEKELSIVVDWCLAGLQRLLKRDKFDIPESVNARTTAEKISSNSVLSFVQDYGYRASGFTAPIAKSSVLELYIKYAEEHSLTEYGGVEFWKRMSNAIKGMVETQKRVGGKPTRFVNLTTKTEAEEKAEQDEIEKAFK